MFPDRRSQDATEAAERKFERARGEGRSYRRIREELDRITAEAGTDPLVYFDSARIAAAADILKEFSKRSQVIFFTCHDHHARQFGGCHDD